MFDKWNEEKTQLEAKLTAHNKDLDVIKQKKTQLEESLKAKDEVI